MLKTVRREEPVFPILEWFDDVGVCHVLVLSGPDVTWLSQMNISVDDREIVAGRAQRSATLTDMTRTASASLRTPEL